MVVRTVLVQADYNRTMTPQLPLELVVAAIIIVIIIIIIIIIIVIID